MPLNELSIGKSNYQTRFGEFEIRAFSFESSEAILLIKDNIRSRENVLCRIQTECIHHNLCGSEYCDCDRKIEKSLELISNEGGLFILLKHDGGIISKISDQEEELTNYNIVPEVIKYFDIKSLRIISINKGLISQINTSLSSQQFITHMLWYRGRNIFFDKFLKDTAEKILNNKLYKPINSDGNNIVLVIGDLNVDQINDDNYSSHVKGSGYNAWLAFGEDNNYKSILFGKVGIQKDNGQKKIIDALGEKILDEIDNKITDNINLYAIVGLHDSLQTCKVKVNRMGRGMPYYYDYDPINANDYDIDNLSQALKIINFSNNDYIFISSYLFCQKKYDIQKCKDFFNVIKKAFPEEANRPKIILDVVRFTIDPKPLPFEGINFGIEELNLILSDIGRVYAVIAEYSSLIKLINNNNDSPHDPETILTDEIVLFQEKIHADYIICRYSYESSKKQTIIKNIPGKKTILSESIFRDYDKNNIKIGYGDKQTVKAISFIAEH